MGPKDQDICSSFSSHKRGLDQIQPFQPLLKWTFLQVLNKAWSSALEWTSFWTPHVLTSSPASPWPVCYPRTKTLQPDSGCSLGCGVGVWDPGQDEYFTQAHYTHGFYRECLILPKQTYPFQQQGSEQRALSSQEAAGIPHSFVSDTF